VRVHTTACAGSTIHLLLDGKETATATPMAADNVDFTGTATVTSGAGRHWLRIEVRNGKGDLQLVSSPLYVNFP
jgi:hypothetical protein